MEGIIHLGGSTMKHEFSDNPEHVKPTTPMPAQQAAPAWEKSDGDADAMRPAPPLWIRYMNSRAKEFCKG